MAEASDDFLSALTQMIDGRIALVNTSIEGTIVSYAGGFATVKPSGQRQFPDGDALDYPNIYKVPVRWPTFMGGQAGFKGPVTAGDSCLLVFAQQATDGSQDARRFDLSDAYAVICSNSQAGLGGNNEDLVMYIGAAYIKLTQAGGLEINAPAGTRTIAPTNVFTGNINGQGGFDVTGGTSGTANITGNVNITGTVSNNGKNIGSTHTHGGVTTGPGTTGVVS